MGSRRDTFAPEEWYHCFTRGVDKRRVFGSTRDYERFLQTLYVSNDTAPTNRDNFKHLDYENILQLPRTKQLVAIGAYCLMPTHYHLLLREVYEGGITKFMHKVGTGYTMYFNAKNQRVGNLFVGPFRSRHIGDDQYFRRVAQYIHLNPAELFEPKWKEGIVNSPPTLERKLREYRFSSLQDYIESDRPERSILDAEAIELLKNPAPLSKIISEAAAYYAQLGE